jgi:hypothetical protein
VSRRPTALHSPIQPSKLNPPGLCHPEPKAEDPLLPLLSFFHSRGDLRFLSTGWESTGLLRFQLAHLLIRPGYILFAPELCAVSAPFMPLGVS